MLRQKVEKQHCICIRNRRRVRGFLLFEFIWAIFCSAILCMAISSATYALYSYYGHFTARQEAWQQFYYAWWYTGEELRYGQHFIVTDRDVRFERKGGERRGLRLYLQRLYVILSDGTQQPVTGNSGTGFAKELRFLWDESRFSATDEGGILYRFVYEMKKKDSCSSYIYPLESYVESLVWKR